MDVSCSILRETKVGVEVRAHRRHPDPSISALANGLLKRWKSLFSSTAPLAASAKAGKGQRGGTLAHVSATVASTSAEAAEAASEAVAVRDSAATLQVRQRAVEGFAAVLRRVDKSVDQSVGKSVGNSVGKANGGQAENIGEPKNPLKMPSGTPLSSPADLDRIAQQIEQEAFVEGEGDTDSYRSKVR